MPGTAQQGSVDQTSILTNRQIIDMSSSILRPHADNAPFAFFAQTLPLEDAIQEEFQWMNRDDYQATVTVTAAAGAGAGTLVVRSDDEKRLIKNHLLINKRTNEQFLVTATPTTTSVAVETDWGGLGAAAVNAGDEFFISARAMEYSSGRGDTINLEPVVETNFVQTTRFGWKVDGRVQATSTYGPSALDFVRDDNMRQFWRELERKYLFQWKAKKTVSGIGTITTSGGMQYFMQKSGSTAFRKDFTQTPLTKSVFDEALQEVFTQGEGTRKLMICGWNIKRIISNWAWAKGQLTLNQEALDKIGISIFRYESDFGIIDIMPHKQWTTELGLNDVAWLLDPTKIKRRALSGRGSVSLFTGPQGDQLQDSHEDSLHQELWVEDGLEVRNVETMAEFTGISA